MSVYFSLGQSIARLKCLLELLEGLLGLIGLDGREDRANRKMDEAVAFGVDQPPAVSDFFRVKEPLGLGLLREIATILAELDRIAARTETRRVLKCSRFHGCPFLVARFVLHIDLQWYGSQCC